MFKRGSKFSYKKHGYKNTNSNCYINCNNYNDFYLKQISQSGRYIITNSSHYRFRCNNHSKGLESKSQFFSKYAGHSKIIVKILKNGYGNQEILGSINDFEIKYPKEPEIEDMGTAKKHLEKDYPKIWKLKEDVFEESKKYCDETKEIIENFKEYIK